MQLDLNINIVLRLCHLVIRLELSSVGQLGRPISSGVEITSRIQSQLSVALFI